MGIWGRYTRWRDIRREKKALAEARARKPEKVFTPRAKPQPEMFAERNDPDLSGQPGLQKRVENALVEQGAQLLIYGDTGVGKSTLLRYAARGLGAEVVSESCMSDRSYEDILKGCLSQLVDFTEVGYSESVRLGTESEVGGDVKAITVKGRIKSEFGQERRFEVVRKSPIDALLQAMAATGRNVIVFDNFQNVNRQRDRLLTAQTMELLSDRAEATGDAKLVVIGIADDAANLLAAQQSPNRRAVEIGVPRMPDAEIEQVLRTGFELLGIDASAEALATLLFYSDGFPFFAHLLGLAISRESRRVNVYEIVSEMLDRGLEEAADEVAQSYRERVRQAIEVGGSVQPRRRILELLAHSAEREWTVGDVTDLFEQQVGGREDWSFLAAALAALTQPKHGSILKRTGTAGRYVYKFKEPHLRPYLRIVVF